MKEQLDVLLGVTGRIPQAGRPPPRCPRRVRGRLAETGQCVSSDLKRLEEGGEYGGADRAAQSNWTADNGHGGQRLAQPDAPAPGTRASHDGAKKHGSHARRREHKDLQMRD